MSQCLSKIDAIFLEYAVKQTIFDLFFLFIILFILIFITLIYMNFLGIKVTRELQS